MVGGIIFLTLKLKHLRYNAFVPPRLMNALTLANISTEATLSDIH